MAQDKADLREEKRAEFGKIHKRFEQINKFTFKFEQKFKKTNDNMVKQIEEII